MGNKKCENDVRIFSGTSFLFRPFLVNLLRPLFLVVLHSVADTNMKTDNV
jgi:hypothetical protein